MPIRTNGMFDNSCTSVTANIISQHSANVVECFKFVNSIFSSDTVDRQKLVLRPTM